MAWFRRSGKQDAAREAERVAREAAEMVDPYAERAMVVEGDRVAVDPAQLLHASRSMKVGPAAAAAGFVIGTLTIVERVPSGQPPMGSLSSTPPDDSRRTHPAAPVGPPAPVSTLALLAW